jgi:hypothetical protein
MLTLAYFSSDERISGLLNLLVWWPGGIIVSTVMWFSPGHYWPIESVGVTPFLVAACLLVVFLVGFVFTAIKSKCPTQYGSSPIDQLECTTPRRSHG